MRVSSALHHLLSVLISVSLLLTPAASTAQAQEGGPIWLPFVGNGTTAPASDRLTRDAYVPDVVIVQVKEGVSLSAEPNGSRGRRYQTNSVLLDGAFSALAITSVTPLLAAGQANQLEKPSRVASPLF